MITKKGNEAIAFDKELTITELFTYLKEHYGEEFFELLWDKQKKSELSSFLSIIINGHSYRDENFMKRILRDGDDISFVYIFFGG